MKFFRPKAKVGVNLNVKYQLRDKDGNIKKVFRPNLLFSFLIKKGILSPYAPKVPVLFGSWGDSLSISNLITNAGFAGVASRINGAGAEAAFDYIAVGIGATAANVADTTLDSEIVDSGLARAQATASRVTTDVTNDTAQLVETFTVTGTKAVVESGVFNAASTGTLLARQVFSVINVVSGDSLQITWKIDAD